MMDLANLPDELIRSKTKIAKIDARKDRASGLGATTSGQALVQRYHDRLTEAFSYALEDAHSGQRSEAELVVTLRGLSPALLALCSIQTVIHSIGMRETLTTTLTTLGQAVAAECWAHKLTEDNPKQDKAVNKARKELIARLARSTTERHSNVGRRAASMESKVTKAIKNKKLPKSYKARRWAPEALVAAGGWLWNVMSTALPEVFVRETAQQGPKSVYSIRLSPGSWAIVDQALDRAVLSNPVYWPTATEPKPWAGWNDGGSWDDRVTASVLRSYHRDTQAAVKAAIKSGSMQKAVDAINVLQAVAFKINTQVLGVLDQCEQLGIKVKGMVPEDMARPVKPNSFSTPTWAEMDKQQQGRWLSKARDIDKRNAGFMSDRILFSDDMKAAWAMLEHRRFYTPMNCDWRGRIYALSHFNFQREDRVRALFLFADGEEIGTEGIEWLKVHTANCGDFRQGYASNSGHKISKRPLKERRQWCNDNIQLITQVASEPLVHTEWMLADKPFLFLAACFELAAALAQGPSYITQLPISFDGSCSGLQHLSAMTRAEEGSLVNLTPAEFPQDVYQLISDDTFAAIEADLNHEPDPEAKDADAEALRSKDIRALAALFMAYTGNRRTLLKRNVMTYAYSSKTFGMSAQQQTDLMEPLVGDVLDGKLEEHPFEGYQHGPYDKHGNQQPSKAARYIAGHAYKAIIARIHKPAEAMEFLQKIAKAMAHEGKPVIWTSPVGIPWINRYHAPNIELVSLFLNDGGVKLRTRLSVATGDKKDIDKSKAANGVAPNFVHALDASHLLLVALAANAEGIHGIATVHDSFGCLASRATRFNAIIREQFSQMYKEHDVLAEILAQARLDLTEENHWRLPPQTPVYGQLNLEDILHADFAFA